MENYNPVTFKVLNFSYCGLDCLKIAKHFIKNHLTGLFEPLCHEHFVQRYESTEELVTIKLDLPYSKEWEEPLI